METKRVEKNKVIRVGVPVETWMAGDLFLFVMDLGKEGSAYTSSAFWKKEGSIEGQLWTLEKLNEHLKRLEPAS